MCLFGSKAFVPLTWFCKKQTAVSHSSTEAEFIALDASLRLEGIPCLQFWELVVSVFHPELVFPMDREPIETTRIDAFNVDWVPPSFPPSKGITRLYMFEDNEPVIKMTIKGRSPQMRHMPRTHRIDFDWVLERLSLIHI